MSNNVASSYRFLEEKPGRTRQYAAIEANMAQWFSLHAQFEGGWVHRTDDAIWTYAPADNDSAILFPKLDAATVGERIDTILAEYRACRSLQGALYWSPDPVQPTDIEARLLARGFEWNWQPHWMWLDLSSLPTTHDPSPEGLHIELVQHPPVWNSTHVPYYSRKKAVYFSRVIAAQPRQIWHCAALLNGKFVGHSMLNLTYGELGIAGIYSVGVAPKARQRGIGSALVIAACRIAQELGCKHAMLNATPMGAPMYRRVGFTDFGDSPTRLIKTETLARPPSTAPQIAYAEAVATGDVQRLDALHNDTPFHVSDETLPSGLTLLHIATRLQHTGVAEWLVQHGATLDVLSAWDLGWKDRAIALLATSPEHANQQSGSLHATPVHDAIERNDLELLHVLLAAQPDLTLRDSVYKSTAIEWAHFFKRTEMIDLLEQYSMKTI